MYVFVGRLYSAARRKQKEKKKLRQESVKNMKQEMDNDNNSNIIPWNLPVKTFYMHTFLSFSSFLFILVSIYFLV